MALGVATVGESAKPGGVQRLSKYQCRLSGPGIIRECKNKRGNVEAELKELTSESVLIAQASWRNNTGNELCVSLDNGIPFPVSLIGPEIFGAGEKQDYGFIVSFVGITEETITGSATVTFADC